MPCTVTAVVMAQDHLIHAEIETDGRRLLEVVDDRRSDFLHVKKALIYRRDSTLVAETCNAVLPKRCLALLAIVNGPHEAPGKRYDNFTAKKALPALLIVVGCEICGKVHLSGSEDPVLALTNELTRFFPVADAEIGLPGPRRGLMKSPVVIVNSARVSFLQIGDFTRPTARAPASAFGESILTSAASLALGNK